MGLEAIALVDIEKAGVRQEHHLVAKLLQRLADTHRIQRRPEGGFREQRDHLFVPTLLLTAGFPPAFLTTFFAAFFTDAFTMFVSLLAL